MRFILYTLMIVFASCLDIFMSNMSILPLSPAYTLIPLFFIVFFLTYNLNTIISNINTHTLAFLFGLFLLSVLFSVIGRASSEMILTDIVNSLIACLLYFCFYVIFVNNDPKEIKIVFFISLLIISGSVLYDTFFGLDPFNPNLRKGGFASNPNIAATSLRFLGICYLFMARKNKFHRNIILFLLAISIFITFSRSGIIGFILIALLLIHNNFHLNFNLKASKIITSTLKITFAFALLYFSLLFTTNFLQKEIPAFAEGDAGKRINLLLGKTDNSTIISQDDEGKYGRKNLLIDYGSKFLINPFGYGTSFTSDVSISPMDTHNFYLKAAVPYGILGLVILTVFFITSIKKAFNNDNFFYLVFILALMLEGFASHNTFIERPTLMAIAFMDSILYGLKTKAAESEKYFS